MASLDSTLLSDIRPFIFMGLVSETSIVYNMVMTMKPFMTSILYLSLYAQTVLFVIHGYFTMLILARLRNYVVV